MQRQQSAQEALAKAMESGDPNAIARARTAAAAAGVKVDQPDYTLDKARYGLTADLMKTYAEQRPTSNDGKPIPFEQWAQPAFQAATGRAAAPDPRAQALSAIQAGANRDAVNQRLKAMGLSPV